MGHTQQRPILITGAGRRIGLALAHHFLNLRHPVIVSYRTEYPSIEGLRHAGAVCIQADFSTDEGILAFAEKVKSTTPGCGRLFTTPVPGFLKKQDIRSAKRSPA